LIVPFPTSFAKTNPTAVLSFDPVVFPERLGGSKALGAKGWRDACGGEGGLEAGGVTARRTSREPRLPNRFAAPNLTDRLDAAARFTAKPETRASSSEREAERSTLPNP